MGRWLAFEFLFFFGEIKLKNAPPFRSEKNPGVYQESRTRKTEKYKI